MCLQVATGCVTGWSMYHELAVAAGVCIAQHVMGLTEAASLLTSFVCFASQVANNQTHGHLVMQCICIFGDCLPV